jgi:hypothetical protein
MRPLVVAVSSKGEAIALRTGAVPIPSRAGGVHLGSPGASSWGAKVSSHDLLRDIPDKKYGNRENVILARNNVQ